MPKFFKTCFTDLQLDEFISIIAALCGSNLTVEVINNINIFT